MLSSLVDALVAVPVWVLLTLVFTLPALEASAFLGLVVPGETAVVVGGVAAHAHRVPLLAVALLALGGAVVGDQVGYLVGRRWGPALVARVPEDSRRARGIHAALALVGRRGSAAVVLGRWTATLRSLVPGIAGMGGMDRRRFTIANLLGAVLWAVVVSVGGYLAGASYQALERQLGLVADVGLALLVVAALVWWGREWSRRRSAPVAP